MNDGIVDLEVLLPVHNEEESIEATIRELVSELSSRLSVRIIVCEDGSSDNTKAVLRKLAEELPLKLILSDEKKGYSRAVVDGMRALEAPYLLCIDADGQCDPTDFWEFWKRRNDCDLVVGWRRPRRDPWPRRVMSGTFQFLYNLVFRVPLHDPSCPYILLPDRVVERMAGDLRHMPDGCWWELNARARMRGLSVFEQPINHRSRKSGKTRVFTLKRLANIGWVHARALFVVRREERAASAASHSAPAP